MTPELRALLAGIADVLDTGASLMPIELLSQWPGVRWAIEMIDEVLTEDDEAMLSRLLEVTQ